MEVPQAQRIRSEDKKGLRGNETERRTRVAVLVTPISDFKLCDRRLTCYSNVYEKDDIVKFASSDQEIQQETDPQV